MRVSNAGRVNAIVLLGRSLFRLGLVALQPLSIPFLAAKAPVAAPCLRTILHRGADVVKLSCSGFSTILSKVGSDSLHGVNLPKTLVLPTFEV